MTLPAPRRLHNLPTQLTTFIGREKEIAEIKRLLPGTRLLTLTGAGGCGKTRLALEIGARLMERFPDGVWWVELAALSDPDLVPHAVATAFGVREQPGRSLIDILVGYLRPRSLLLLLDNCEHLQFACARLSDTLLECCAELQILATSRHALDVRGETKWRVPSLSHPMHHSLPSMKGLTRYEAVRLFCERARAADPTFTLSRRNARSVVEVCANLDGIPLALELAAARLPVLTVAQIAERLCDRFRLLTGGRQNGLPRQQTLRATMDWSYGLLSEMERALLRRLSVFTGGWTLVAAEAICGGAGIEASQIINLLAQLVDKSVAVAETRDGEARYHLLETVRQYSFERLTEFDEATRTRNRHLRWFADLGERAYPDLREIRWECHQQTLERLRKEHDNLRAALTWSSEHNMEIGLQLAGALGRFWSACSHYGEGRAWLTQFLEKTKGFATSGRTRALRYAGFLAWLQGDYRQAAVLGEEGLVLARRLRHKEHTAGLLHMLGLVYRDVGSYKRAARLLEEGQQLFEALGDMHYTAETMRQRGRLAYVQGEYSVASALLERSLDLYQKRGSKGGIAYTLLFLGHVRRYEGDLDQAVHLLQKSLLFFRDLGATEGRAGALTASAHALRQVGNHEQALRLYEEGLILSRDLGLKLSIQGCLYGIASLNASQGRPERALQLFAAAEVVREDSDYALPAPDREAYERAVTEIRAMIDGATFTATWAEGRAMTLEQAIEYALSSPDGDRHKPTAARDVDAANRPAPLAPREREVAALVAQGLTNHEIASRLAITQRTAETHVQHILNKLGFDSRSQIAVWATENGLREVTLS